ncbi:nitric-oxide synthase, partial [Zopfochytrium polystomum]
MDKTNLPLCDAARSKHDIIAEAGEFLEEYYRDCHPLGPAGLQPRLLQVVEEVRKKGYYFQTPDELAYGVKLAWRNSARCIMRVQWRNIQVRDARGPDAEYGRRITNDEMFDTCVRHLREAVTEASNGSKVVSSHMTVFPQILPGDDFGRRIWNAQLVRFAGYRLDDGTVLGDPAHVELTDICVGLGWKPPAARTAFDVLPLIIQANDNAPPLCRELPADAVLLVPITHPEYPRLADLQLKWHAVPAISAFTLDIGGIQYPCAPFNGWYMDAEIACRNLADPQRYDLLPAVAAAMGLPDLDGGNSHDLARDRALVELAVAVLGSFDSAGVTMVDHHTASDSFTRHFQKEMDERGFIPADWVWITPPIGGSANSVFHQ